MFTIWKSDHQSGAQVLVPLYATVKLGAVVAVAVGVPVDPGGMYFVGGTAVGFGVGGLGVRVGLGVGGGVNTRRRPATPVTLAYLADSQHSWPGWLGL